jgi:hypothetical protein
MAAIEEQGAGLHVDRLHGLEGLFEASGAHGHHEHVLDAHPAGGVTAARDDVDHREGEHGAPGAPGAQVAPQGDTAHGGAGLGARGRHGHHGVSSEHGAVLGAVRRDERRVDLILGGGIHTGQDRRDLGPHPDHGPVDAEAVEAVGIAVADLE